jgi:NAD(P)-dependent dehydrogenase (short-subunit alcohol dehydrogenase family)
VITSVAGDRGRRSNFTYGTAKGALGLFAQGMRARLYPARVRVLTIKPGPVATPMTAALAGAGRMASPQVVAAGIYRAMTSGRVEVLYIPGYWRLIMRMIREIPESIGKKLKF